MRTVTLEGFADLPRPNLAWIIHHMLPKPGTVLMVGKPKAGKSFLALQIAMSVAQGRDFIGSKTEQGPVLYLQLDTSETVWRDRLRKLRECGMDMTGPVFTVHPDDMPSHINILEDATQAWLRALLKQDDPKLVIVDVMRNLHSNDENDSTAMKRVGDCISDVFRGRSLLLLHHAKKLDAKQPDLDISQVGRGSSYMMGAVDAIWFLHGNKLQISNRWDEPTSYNANQDDNGVWVFREEKELLILGPKLVALCTEFPGMSHHKLAGVAKDRFGISRPTYYRYMAGRVCAHVTIPASVAVRPG
jgi:hypothetical protein